MDKKTSSHKGKYAGNRANADAPAASSAAADTTQVMNAAFAQNTSDDQNSAVFAGAQFGMEAVGKKSRYKHGKAIAIVLGVLIGIILIVYVAGVVYFSGRFYPNTTAGRFDLSLNTLEEVQQELEDAIDNYTLSVSGQGFSLELDSETAGLSLDSSALVSSMHEDINAWLWPFEVFLTHDETEKLITTYNESGLEEIVRAAVEDFNAGRTAPQDATIVFDETSQAFVVQEEQAGTTLNADAVISAVDAAVLVMDRTLALEEDCLEQPSVFSDDEALADAISQANSLLGTDLTLTLDDDVVAEVDASLISQWVVLGEDLSVTLDQETLSAWVSDLASQCNTVGTTRTYTRADGKEITVSGGVYGWEIDSDALLTQVQDAVLSATVDTQAISCISSGDAYNGVGQRDWGNRYVDIDLSEQHVYFYDENGDLIWESDCISGIPDGEHDTAVGVYWLNSKESPSVLIGYEDGEIDYETEVQYWMPFVGNSIGLHDASWQSAFGGSLYTQGYGSHGCVNLPTDKAAELYELIQVGDCVISHW